MLETTPKTGKTWSVGSLTYDRRGLANVFGWLLTGDFALQMKDRAINPIAQIMLRRAGAAVWVVGLLVGSVPSAIGLFVTPIVSVQSDRCRSPLGRRIPFILFPTPIIVLMMVGMAFSPELGVGLQHALKLSDASLPACRVGVFALFWAMFEIATIIVNGLFNALVNDVVPQGLIGRFYGLFRFVSLGAGIIIGQYLYGQIENHAHLLLVSLAALYGVGFITMSLKVKEGSYPPPPPLNNGGKSRLDILIGFFRECYTQPFYLWFFAANTLGNFAISPINTYQAFHARSVGMDDKMLGKCVAVSYACSLALSLPLGYIADKIHPLRMAIITIAAYGLGSMYGFLYGTTPSQLYTALLLHTVISGCFFTGTASIGQRLLPRSKFGELSAAGGLIGAFINMIFPPALGVFIGAMHNNYRYSFLIGSLLTVAAFACYLVVLRKFKQLGGDEHYRAPEEDEPFASISDPPTHGL